MATVNEKMTALADEVRALSGTTTKKGIDAMTTDVNAANTEIIEQADLIAQITTALEGKAGGGGGSVKTCTVTINIEQIFCDPQTYYMTVKEGKCIIDRLLYEQNGGAIKIPLQNVICESMIYILDSGYNLPYNSTVIEGTAQVFEIVGDHVVILSPTEEDENCIITLS